VTSELGTVSTAVLSSPEIHWALVNAGPPSI